MEDAILMHFSSSLLKTIEFSFLHEQAEVRDITWSILLRLLCSVFVAYFSWHGEVALSALRTKVTNHFEIMLMRARLRVDLSSSKEAGNKQEGSARDAWHALEGMINYGTQLLTVASQLLLIAHLSRATGSTFAFLCVSKPIISAIFSRTLWDKVSFAFINNEAYTRMKALKQLSTDKYRSEVISGDLGNWIIDEYQRTEKELENFSTEHPFYSYSRRSSSAFDIFIKVIGDLPMVYCAVNAIMYPSKFSVASIAVLQQSSSSLRYSLETILRSTQSFRKSVTSVRKLYEAAEVHNSMVNGTLAYPLTGEKKESLNSEKGMSFALKNVCFSYPGSQKTSHALSNVTLEIKAGALVVIVGANGSGKSTLIKILSRLYDPSSGEILIDGHTSTEYRMEDLHRASTILGQDNLLYPGLSLAENIGLGYHGRSRDIDLIKEAAEEGGALKFMEKLKKGMETTLDPLTESFALNLYGNKTHPLYQEMEEMDKSIDISGGERQRIIAARSFMRFKSGTVKFVAVDEPSSALDAEGELELFNKLIDAREGKTMVFVTHRFGHLTKCADQIICMKDGSVAEIGSHKELIGKNAEYAKLYNIQLSAFDDTKPKAEPEHSTSS